MESIINFLTNIDNRIVLTGATLVILLVVKYIFRKIILKQIISKHFSVMRKRNILTLFNVFYTLVFISSVITIWGIKSKDIIFFASSILTVVGVAFFAQWSILSNITSGVIFFFSGNLKSGDNICIMDTTPQIEGIVENIGIFFTDIKVDGHKITIPNNLFMQKIISYK